MPMPPDIPTPTEPPSQLAASLRQTLRLVHAYKAALEEQGYVLSFTDPNSLPTILPSSVKVQRVEDI